jgi:hypothetical protein
MSVSRCASVALPQLHVAIVLDAVTHINSSGYSPDTPHVSRCLLLLGFFGDRSARQHVDRKVLSAAAVEDKVAAGYTRSKE